MFVSVFFGSHHFFGKNFLLERGKTDLDSTGKKRKRKLRARPESPRGDYVERFLLEISHMEKV